MCVQGWFGIYSTVRDDILDVKYLWFLRHPEQMCQQCSTCQSVFAKITSGQRNYYGIILSLEKYFHFLYYSCEIHHWIYLIDPGHKSMRSVLQYVYLFVCVCLQNDVWIQKEHATWNTRSLTQGKVRTRRHQLREGKWHGRGRYTIIPMDLCVTRLMATRAYLHIQTNMRKLCRHKRAYYPLAVHDNDDAATGVDTTTIGTWC